MAIRPKMLKLRFSKSNFVRKEKILFSKIFACVENVVSVRRQIDD